MRGRKITVPLFITCQRPGCEKVHQVNSRWRQQKQKYCSLKCAAIVKQQSPEGRAASGRGARTRTAQERARLIASVQHLTPIEAFRLGYLRGLHSKHRQIRNYRRQKAA